MRVDFAQKNKTTFLTLCIWTQVKNCILYSFGAEGGVSTIKIGFLWVWGKKTGKNWREPIFCSPTSWHCICSVSKWNINILWYILPAEELVNAKKLFSKKNQATVSQAIIQTTAVLSKVGMNFLLKPSYWFFTIWINKILNRETQRFNKTIV